MRPVRLELNNFGPYLGEHVIDFERLGRHGLFLIHGPTGAGKSCILDGLCFALFGKASGEERSGSDLATTLQQEERCKVVLSFEHRGGLYRITRCPKQEVAKQRGEGTTVRQAEATLEALDEGEVLATKVREADEAVEELLRCTVEQFRQTVVLPQGAFREVITDDGERREILANIFDTRRFAAFAELLNDKARELGRQSQGLQERRAELLADARCENEEQLGRRLELARAEAGRLKEELDRAVKGRDERLREKTQGEALAKQFEEADELRYEQEELGERATVIEEQRRQVECAKRAERLADLRSNLETTRNERRELQEDVAGALAKVTESQGRLEAAEQRFGEEKGREEERLEAQETCGRLEALEKQVGELAKLRGRESEFARQVDELATALDKGEQAVTEAEEERLKLLAKRDELAERTSAERELERRRGVLEGEVKALREIEGHLQEIASLTERIDEQRAGGDPAEGLVLAVREHSPGLLATSLSEGDPCPVCGSEHHPFPAHGDEGLEGLQRAFERFGEAREAVSRFEEARRQLSERATKLAGVHEWAIESLPDVNERDEALGQVVEALAEIEGLAEQVEELNRQVREIDEALPLLREKAKGARAEHGKEMGELSGLRGRLEGLLEQLEPDQRDPEAFALALEQARTRHGELQQALADAKEGALLAKAEVEKRQGELTLLEGRLRTAEEKLGRLEEEFAERLEKQGFANVEELDGAAMALDDLADLEARITGYDEQVRKVREGRARLTELLAGKERPDLEALETHCEEAARAYEEANEAWHQADMLRQQLHELYGDLKVLERKHGNLKGRIEAARKLADLACGRMKGRSRVDFETFVLQSIFHSVLSVGNQHLKHMTGGRYSLHLRFSEAASSRGLELDVSDHYNGGQQRPVHTLSGGEGFMASLALALGLSEIAQRTSGGSELGALFIDEGFGSLDPRSLDQAVRILRDLPRDHRMVGVISHVEELKQRIPVQLLVEPGEKGSRVGIEVNA